MAEENLCRIHPSLAAYSYNPPTTLHAWFVEPRLNASGQPSCLCGATQQGGFMSSIENLEPFNAYSLVNGQWRSTTNTTEVLNPATGATVAQVAAQGAELAVEAVEAARAALPSWSKTSAMERSQYLERISQLLLEQIDGLALVLTTEQGKPLAEAREEIEYAASYFAWYAGEALRAYGRLVPAGAENQRVMVRKCPVGVVTAITPWNFPCALLARKLAPALAAGCTFVAKPALETPLTALALGAITRQAGIPPGVVNIVVGADSQAIGEVLTQHPAVAKFTFTGSTAIGTQLLAQCAAGVKRTSLELGGNAPFLVFEDANLEAAVDGLMAAKFRNAGQTCVSPNRILLHQDIAAPFLALLRERMAALQMGDGEDPSTQLGPLIHAQAVVRIQQLVAAAVAAGAKVETFDQAVPGPAFAPPQLVTNINPEMDLFQQEIFGPVVAVMTFSDETNAVQLANATPYGLAAYAYTQNLQRCWRLYEDLTVGMLGLNQGRISSAMAPFGGVKASGFGREGGPEGIEEYLSTHYLAWGDCT